MTELMTYVRRGSRKANQGYAPLADAEALDDDAKENVSPLPVPGKKAASKARASSTEGGDRRSSWIGRMLSYSSSGVTTANDKSGKKNAKVSEAILSLSLARARVAFSSQITSILNDPPTFSFPLRQSGP